MAHLIIKKKKLFLDQTRRDGTWIPRRIFTCSDWAIINKSSHYSKSL